jgi:hypothetical protein
LSGLGRKKISSAKLRSKILSFIVITDYTCGAGMKIPWIYKLISWNDKNIGEKTPVAHPKAVDCCLTALYYINIEP